MNNQDIINELHYIERKLEDHRKVIKGLIKEFKKGV